MSLFLWACGGGDGSPSVRQQIVGEQRTATAQPTMAPKGVGGAFIVGKYTVTLTGPSTLFRRSDKDYWGFPVEICAAADVGAGEKMTVNFRGLGSDGAAHPTVGYDWFDQPRPTGTFSFSDRSIELTGGKCNDYVGAVQVPKGATLVRLDLFTHELVSFPPVLASWVVPTGPEAATPAPTATPAPKSFPAAEQVIDSGHTYTATFKTDKGDIVLNLLGDKAPRTVNAFVFLVRKGFYDGLTFHRVVRIPTPFIVQAGDPTGTGGGGPGFQTEEDKNDLRNLRGSVSMAKAGPVTTFGSQFFINLSDNPALDNDAPNQKRFYPWAQVTPASMAVVDQLVQGDIIRAVTITAQSK